MAASLVGAPAGISWNWQPSLLALPAAATRRGGGTIRCGRRSKSSLSDDAWTSSILLHRGFKTSLGDCWGFCSSTRRIAASAGDQSVAGDVGEEDSLSRAEDGGGSRDIQETEEGEEGAGGGGGGEPKEARREGYREELRNLRAEFEASRQEFWREFKERHVIYRLDNEQWGVGFNPIFTIHEHFDDDGSSRRISRVEVDENEILGRSGVDPKHSRLLDKDSRALTEKRIELAKAHAADIHSGSVMPSPLSVVYQYAREGGALRRTSWATSAATSTSNPVGLSWQPLVALFLPVLLVGLGVSRWVAARKMRKEGEKDPVEQEKSLRAMQMRKLRAQMGREELSEEDYRPRSEGDGDDAGKKMQAVEVEVEEVAVAGGEGTMQVPGGVNGEEFHRKVGEIQAMARKARLQEQEDAEARSAQSLERKRAVEQGMKKERNRVRELENLAQDLNDVRRLGADGPPELFQADVVNSSGNGHHSTAAQEGSSSRENAPPPRNPPALGNQQQAGPLAPGSTGAPPRSPAPGVRPRIILTAEEARASIAAKRARLGAAYSPSTPRSKTGGDADNSNVDDMRRGVPSLGDSAEATADVAAELSRGSEEKTRPWEQETPGMPTEERALDPDDGGSRAVVGDSGDNLSPGDDSSPAEKSEKGVTDGNEVSRESESANLEQETGRRAKVGGRRKKKLRDEEEEMEWMRDEVLRDIVFKVHANEEAGREPFHNLNSEQETLFFKGLERKFEREGDEVKKWIKDRVENIDYGLGGIGVYDDPESYQLKWKEGVDKPPNTDFSQKFMKDRDRILQERRGLTYTSPVDSEETSIPMPSSPASPSASAASVSPVSSLPPMPIDDETVQGRSKEILSGNGKSKTVISSSPRVGGGPNPEQSTGPRTTDRKIDAGKENWDHTKRWAKDLERKYAMERDPNTRALIREMGQDLERWITEEEIEEASRLLEKGPEGEQEYVKKHYETTKAKLKKQREMFGRGAMLNKYSEYKTDEQVELWWLGLPFVVCIGLRAKIDEEDQAGLYSVDVAPALEGVPGLPSVLYHTVAFQDRGDAQNFCCLISSQPEKLGAEGAELVPFHPKELYKDAQAEGFKVTVIKKGQLQLSVDQSFEEVESRILELGSARYYDEILQDRVIDMNSVVDDGLGFGRPPQL